MYSKFLKHAVLCRLAASRFGVELVSNPVEVGILIGCNKIN
jgi:hypothetical protein